MKKKLCIIYGPTGVGKTDYALNFGSNEKIEIINGDVGQFYEPFGIGTAKPNWKEEKIPHHLFDVITEPQDCTVVEYRTMVLKKVYEIWSRNAIPVIVGGSGFYIKSLFFPPPAQECNENLPQKSTENSTKELWEKLKKRDPERAEKLYQQDRYRIERALVLLEKGVKASECVPRYQPLDADVLLLFLKRDRSELYDRINQRTYLMLDQGWIEEVESLMHTPWQDFLMKKKLIGYNDIMLYLQGDCTPEEKKKLLHTIQKKTRNYAKRQLTFWRMLEKLLLQYFKDPSQVLEINVSQDGAFESFKDKAGKFLKG
jgi:tRNA dimethylallyltransferase